MKKPSETVEKELTPEQLVERTAKRKLFREVYEQVKDLNALDAFDLLTEIRSSVQTALRAEQKERKSGSVTVKPATLDEGKHAELSATLWDMLKDLSIEDADSWLGSHAARIEVQGRMKLNDIKVSDLGIEKHLLD